MIERVHPLLWAAALCVLFTALGVVFLPFPGAQYDEVLFVSAIYAPETVEYAMKTGFGAIPVMLITYAGTLKAAIYAPLLAWFGSSHVVLRLPMLLAAALSVGLYFLAARRLAGTKAALLTGLLLATDAIYLLTSVFDWGPVALQHLLFAGALYAGVRYREQARVRWMAVMAFCAGLALWDKAIIVWLLAGFGVSAVVVLRGEVAAAARDRRMALAAVLGFVIGAAPFLYYNKIHPLRTFTSSTEMDRQPALQKIVALDRTFSGGGLFGYLVREDPEGFPQGLQTWEKAPLWLNGKLEGPRQSIQQLVLLGAFLSLPLVWGTGYRRVWLFLALAAVIGWLLMLVTANAGGAMHHTILLWPIPQMLAALALAEVFRRWPGRLSQAAMGVVLVAALHNGLLLNHYLAHFIACGPTWIWSDAIRPLAEEVQKMEGRKVFAADWGMSQQMEFYSQGRVELNRVGDGVVLTLGQDPNSAKHLEAALAEESTVFLTYTEGREVFPDIRARLFGFAEERGYTRTVLKTVHDRHGAPVYEIHEFRR
jgi:hypothetical protein